MMFTIDLQFGAGFRKNDWLKVPDVTEPTETSMVLDLHSGAYD